MIIYSFTSSFISKKPIDKIKNNRLKRLRFKLLPYSFKLEYVPGSKLFIADLLSLYSSKIQ